MLQLKGRKWYNWIFFNGQNLFCIQETHLWFKDTNRLEVEKWNWIFHANGEQKAAQVANFHSVQFSCRVVSTLYDPHEPQHARPPCPSPTPGDYSNSCPLSWWCHPTVSSSVIPFLSCLQSYWASGSFEMNQLFTSGGQSIRVSSLTSVLPMNTQGWSPLGWTGCISLQSKGLTRVFSNTIVHKHQFFGAQLSLQSNSHIHTWPLEKP